jgi:hypothetical protein
VAGSSIRDVLRPYCLNKQIVLQNISYASSIFGVKLSLPPIYEFHPKLKDVKEYMGRDFDEYYKFAFVRHPLDWQKSLYFFMKKNQRHHQHAMISNMSFEQYLDWRINNEVRLMSDFVCDDNGGLLLDDIYHFENIASDFLTLKKKLNLKRDLPHKNAAGLGNEINISNELYSEFRDVYARDFSYFDYQ